jgi:hypothetical protein
MIKSKNIRRMNKAHLPPRLLLGMIEIVSKYAVVFFPD